MKIHWLIVMVLGFVVAALSGPVQADSSVGAARVHAIDGSGVNGRVVLLDSGDPATGLVVSGTASGLDPLQAYVTLVYDRGALPGGPAACLPTGGLTGTQMFVGFWDVAEDGSGSLFVTKTGEAYAPIDDIGAASIRLASMSLQSCGRVHAQP